MANVPVTTPAPVYSFDHDHGVPARTLAEHLGGKGAGLAEMTTALGMPVPPGFTIGVPLCRDYLQNGWPDGLTEQIERHCATWAAASDAASATPLTRCYWPCAAGRHGRCPACSTPS